MIAAMPSSKPRFKLGQMVATPGAIQALQRSGQDPLAFIERHRRADWGDVCPEDATLNDAPLPTKGIDGGRPV